MKEFVLTNAFVFVYFNFIAFVFSYKIHSYFYTKSGLKPTTSDVLSHTTTIIPLLKINAQNVRDGISRRETSRETRTFLSPLTCQNHFAHF